MGLNGNHLEYNKKDWKIKLLIGIPTLGIVRYEWAVHRYGQIIPVNWQLSEFAVTYSPIGFSVSDAYNVIAENFVKNDVEWLLTIEDDVLIPQDLFVKIRGYMEKKRYPVVSGLYFTKSQPAEPLVFRGRGNGAFHNWKLGEKVMADGIPMGCLLVHGSIIRYMWDHSPVYQVPNGQQVRRIFETPREKFFDPKTCNYYTKTGTQDLYWCDRIIKEKVLEHTGWKRAAKEKYPFLVDTQIFCKHIDMNTGRQYP